MNLNKTESTNFIETLKKIPKGLAEDEITDLIYKEANFPREKTEEIIAIINSLFGLKYEEDLTTEEIIDGLSTALKDHDDFRVDAKIIKAFSGFLRSALSLDDTIGLIFKSSTLTHGDGPTFCSVNIYSDIRPVFFQNVDDGFDSAIITHRLNITYHTSDGHSEFQLLLNSENIKVIKRELERAEKKQKSIQKILKKNISLFISSTGTEH